VSEEALLSRPAPASPSSGWGSVIVDPPIRPQGSNENTVCPPRPGAWAGAGLLASIHAAGDYVRELEQHTQMQAQRLQDLVGKVREHLRAAEVRAQQAEEREQQTRLWAQAAIEAASDRARDAEARAQEAEVLLARVAEAIRTEFRDLPASADRSQDQAAA